jgi:benzoate membrane transport protein
LRGSDPDRAQAVATGVVTAIVGFAGAFTVVLSGLRAVGATEDQASSGLLVLTVSMGVVAIVLSLRTRMPMAIAWTTPGAALLVSTGSVDGGWPAAVGAFVVAAALTVLAGLWRPAVRLIASVPAPLASALLAGVLLPVCIAPARAAVELPGLALPVVAAWAVLMVVARRWAVPGALVAAGVTVTVSGRLAPGALDDPWPALAWTTPAFEPGTIIGVALPLFLVTMASQNLTGLSVLQLNGYRPDLGPVLTTTGAVSAAIAPLGGHGINLAAITAAMTAGPDAHPDPDRRWVATVVAGAVHCLLGLTAGAVAALAAASPPLLIQAVAGLALLGALTSALAAAFDGEGDTRDAAVVTLVVTASAITVTGISAPFWGLLAGLAFLGLHRARYGRPRTVHEPAVPAQRSARETS